MTEIGNIWNANDTNLGLNFSLSYYCKDPVLNVGGDDDGEWFYYMTIGLTGISNGKVRTNYIT